MVVYRKRSTTIAPAALSNSYLIGSERSGTSTTTLISWGGFGPTATLSMFTAGTPLGCRDHTGSGPGDQWRQRHQDRVRVAAGLEAELGAAVVQQVELHVAPAPLQLIGALGVGPGAIHVPRDQPRVDVEERLADLAGEREVTLQVVLQVVVEDAADAAVLAAMRQIEVLVRPRLEARVVVRVERGASLLETRMERARVRLVRHDRIEIGAAAEPGPRGLDVPGVHVRGRHVRRT